MTSNWPNSIPSRHRNLRRRAEAYASALYYSECSLGGISPRGAAEAEENARTLQSRWWLKGNDPNHPSMNGQGSSVASETITSCDAEAAKGGPKPNQARESVDMNGVDDVPVEEESGTGVVNNPIEDDSNAPILARDDDLGSSFGTLKNFSCIRKVFSYSTASNLVATQRDPQPLAVSTHSLLLPPWLTGPHTSPLITSTAPMLKQDEGSSEEMLNAYSSYPNQLLASKPSVVNTPHEAVQVTSESDADDSTIFSGSLSCDSNNFHPISNYRRGIPCSATRSKKRIRDDILSTLDQTYLDAKIDAAKAELLSRLRDEGNSPGFKTALDTLEKHSLLKASANKKRKLSSSNKGIDGIDIDGTWMMISPPDYPSIIGKNSEGDCLFTLGRMTFGMFEPSDLICSIQKQYNTVKSVKSKDLPLYVPKSLRREVASERGRKGGERLKTYNIIASFTVEQTNGTYHSENATSQDPLREPLRGILTNYGYALPDPSNPNRKSIWFTGGTIEPADERSMSEWKTVFGAKTANGQSPVEADEAKTLASKMLLGVIHEPMDDQGVVGYHLNRPIGGHGNAYCDVVYIDGDLRVMRGNSGSIYVFRRV